MQLLTIHLEETDCFAAWVTAKDVGITQATDGADPKSEGPLRFDLVFNIQ